MELRLLPLPRIYNICELLLQPMQLRDWPNCGDRECRNDRHRKAGITWAVHSKGAPPAASPKPRMLIIHSTKEEEAGKPILVREQSQIKVIKEEEAVADVLCTHCQHPHWGTEVLDLAVLMSTIQIHSRLHLLHTNYC